MAKKRLSLFRWLLGQVLDNIWTWIASLLLAALTSIRSYLDELSLGVVILVGLVTIAAVLVVAHALRWSKDAFTNWRKPRLVVTAGEVQLGSAGELLFRARVSVSNGSEIDRLECRIYDAMAVPPGIDPFLDNRLRAMRQRPLERMHFYGEHQRLHQLAEGDSADFDLIYETPAREWKVRFAMEHMRDEAIPQGRYCFTVHACAPGAKSGIESFDAWPDKNGRLAFSVNGANVSIAEQHLAATQHALGQPAAMTTQPPQTNPLSTRG